MIIPPVIRIGINTIMVVQKPMADIDSDCNGGWAHWEKNVLYLANDMPEDRKMETFFHEILHFINVYLPEEQVTFLSSSILQVIRDNKLDFLKK